MEPVLITEGNEIQSLTYFQSHMAFPECFRFEISIREETKNITFKGNFAQPMGSQYENVSFEDTQIDRSVLDCIRAIVIKHRLIALHKRGPEHKHKELKEADRKRFLELNKVCDYTSSSFEITFDDFLIINHNNDSLGLKDAMSEIRDYLTEVGLETAKKAKRQ